MVKLRFFAEYEYGMPSEIGFAHENNYVTRGVDAEVAVPVLRSFSDRGRMEIGWATREHSAEAGKDFVDGNGLLVFEEGQTEATIHIPLLHPSTRGARELSFIVELGNVDGDASVGRYETNVHIRPPSSEAGEGGSVRIVTTSFSHFCIDTCHAMQAGFFKQYFSITKQSQYVTSFT